MMVTSGNLLDGLTGWFYKHVGKKYPKLHFVLFQCEKCFAGQLALWYVIIIMSREYGLVDVVYYGFLLVLLSIFFARIIGGILIKYL
jgi:hypothetical protein